MPSFFQKNKRMILAVILIGLIASPLALVPINKVEAQGAENPVEGGWLGLVINFFGDWFAWIMNNLLIPTAAWILGLAGNLMDMAIKFSLDTKYFKIDAIDSGWKLIRDLVNMGFIFILLYIAISTILQLSSYNIRSMLAKLIIAAVLINFSLFFTRVAIDASNIVAQNFYNAFTVSADGNPNISATFKNYLRISEKFEKNSGKPLNIVGIDSYRDAVLRFVVIVVALYVFLSVALLFVARTVAFIFLMMTAPIGFIGAIFPGASGAAAQWRKTLIDQMLVAPVFLILIYLVAQIMKASMFNLDLIGETEKALDVNFYFNYVIIIALLLFTKNITKKISGKAGAMINDFGKKALAVAAGATVAVATGGAALAGRAAIGRGAAMLASSGELKDMAAKKGVAGFIGRTTLAASDKIAKSSFEARNVGMFQKAAGLAGVKVAKTKTGEGGFKGTQERKTEKVREFAEKLAPSAAETRQKAESYATAKVKKDNLEKQAEQNVKNNPAVPKITDADKQNAKAALDKDKKDLADKQADLKIAQSVNPQAAAAAQTRLNQAQQALTQAENKEQVLKNNEGIVNQMKQTEMERLVGSPDKLKQMNQDIAARKQELDMVTPNAQGVTPRQQAYAQQQKQPGVAGGGPAAGAERGVGNAADTLAEKIKEAMIEAGGKAAEQMAKAMGTSTENLEKELGLAMADLNKVRPGEIVNPELRTSIFDNLENRIESLGPAFSAVSNESAQKVSQSVVQIKQGLANISQPSVTESVIQKITWTPQWKREAADKIIAGEKLKKKKGGKDQKKLLEDMAELLGEEMPSQTPPSKPPAPPTPPTTT